MKTNIQNKIGHIESQSIGNTSHSNESLDLAILSELASIGAGHAATALSDILQQQVFITVPRIHDAPAHLLPKLFGLHEMPTTALYIRLAVGPECDILVMLEAEEARKVAAMMTMAPSVDDLDPVLEASAVEELANIIVGSFLSAISDFISMTLVPAPPIRIVDAFDAILDELLVKNSMMYKRTVIFDISFTTTAQISKCMMLLFPSPDLEKLLLEKSKVLVENAP
jgi:chemotaxis protein CheC